MLILSHVERRRTSLTSHIFSRWFSLPRDGCPACFGLVDSRVASSNTQGTYPHEPGHMVSA